MKIVAAGNKKLTGSGCMAPSCLEKVKKTSRFIFSFCSRFRRIFLPCQESNVIIDAFIDGHFIRLLNFL
jgi:hypothetical protein